MNEDIISRRAALEAMDTWDKFGCDPDGKLVRYDDDKHYVPYVHYEDMVHAVKNLPPMPPTLYGYKIEHLAYIARVMEKEGITAEQAAESFDDMVTAIRLLIEETAQTINEFVREMRREEQDNEQTGMQACIPAAQTGDGSGNKQEGSAEGGGDLQAEAIRSSERPAETEENR